MDLYNLKKNKLEEVDRVNFKLEKEIQTLVEENVETLFNLEFISSEFSVSSFRLDSLCFDNETNSFVVIEYKRGSSYSVIDQGYSYMSTMLNNKSDFILEYIEKTGKSLKKSDVDFSQSRILFVSPSFNSYQKNSVNFKDVPFELWEIKKYSNGTIGLDQHVSSSNESIELVEGSKNSVIKNVGKEVKVYTEESFFINRDKFLKELYDQLKERISNWDGLKIDCNKNNIRIKNNKKIKIYVNIQKQGVKVGFLSRVDFGGNVKSVKNRFILDDPKQLFSFWENKYRESYSYKLTNDKHLDYVILMLKQKYES
jgi:frataxin-like iron-binding protein CyaY